MRTRNVFLAAIVAVSMCSCQTMFPEDRPEMKRSDSGSRSLTRGMYTDWSKSRIIPPESTAGAEAFNEKEAPKRWGRSAKQQSKAAGEKMGEKAKQGWGWLGKKWERINEDD